MLNAVAVAMRTANRATVLRHPNSIDAQVWRRQVVRTAGAEAGSIGGLPTLGGAMVMDSEDEDDVEFEKIGDAKVLFTENYQGTTLADNRASAEATEVRLALIEPVEKDAFEPKDGDLVYLLPGADVVIPMEVTKVLSMVEIPPYVVKYELSAQGDLLFEPGLAVP
jgi:hypothetical protein